MTKVVGLLCSRVSSAFVDGWLLMLLVGDVHHMARGVPPFGYWLSMFAAYVGSAIAGTGTIWLKGSRGAG